MIVNASYAPALQRWTLRAAAGEHKGAVLGWAERVVIRDAIVTGEGAGSIRGALVWWAGSQNDACRAVGFPLPRPEPRKAPYGALLHARPARNGKRALVLADGASARVRDAVPIFLLEQKAS